MRTRALLFLASLVLVAPGYAQVNATFSTFGAGCAGTGTGLSPAITVLPANMANQFGSGSSLPFGWSPVRYQQVFSGAELPFAFTMAGLSLRQPNRGPLSNRFILDLQIQVGYTTRTPATMSTTFATNFDSGAPVVVLPRTQLPIPRTVVTGPTSPMDFFFTIPWPATFDWVPAAGRNFLVQVTVFGNSYGGTASGYAFDAGSGSTVARLYGSTATSTTGTLERGIGLVMGLRALTHTAVPELYSTDTPMISGTFRIRLAHARASTFALLLLGWSRNVWVGGSLPSNLWWIGAPRCALLSSIVDVQTMSISSAGLGSHTYNVPNNIYLLGHNIYNQALVADPAANASGFAFTNGGAGVIGNQ